MPHIRKLSQDEVQRIEGRRKGPRRILAEQYDALLDGYEIGDYGEVELELSEKRLTIRHRLNSAADRRGVKLRFLRTQNDQLMRFRVIIRPDSGEDDEDEDEDEGHAEMIPSAAPAAYVASEPMAAPEAPPIRRPRRTTKASTGTAEKSTSTRSTRRSTAASDV